MLKKVIDYENMTEEELNVWAEKSLKREEEIGAFFDTICPMVYGKVNEWLEKRPQGYLEAIFQLADSSELKKLLQRDYTLYIFMKMCRAGEMEQQQHLMPVISKFRSLEEMKQIYQRTVFLIRRIELGFPKELCEDFYTLVEEWDFSAYYLLEVILEKKAVYARYDLVESVVEGLIKRGRKKDADIILITTCKLAETEGEDCK